MKKQSINKIEKLRELLINNNLDAYLIPHSNKQLNDTILDQDHRIKFMVGFTGSAGSLIVSKNNAVLFIDGRYEIQAENEVDNDNIRIINITKCSIKNWLSLNLSRNNTIGYDPKLYSIHQISILEELLETHGIKIEPIKQNLIDKLWEEKPQNSKNIITRHLIKYSGIRSSEKLLNLRKQLQIDSCDAIFITSGSIISWLYNIRSHTMVHTPNVEAYAYISENKSIIFCNEQYADRNLIRWLKPETVIIDFKELNRTMKSEGLIIQNIQIDMHGVSKYFEGLFESLNIKIIKKINICIEKISIKNTTEINGSKMAHIKDGVALTSFLYWFYNKSYLKEIDEIAIDKKLYEYRTKDINFIGNSFDVIAGSASNGAIIHYRANYKTNQKIKNNNILLIDSGGQYLNGTTDITRTISVGNPSKKMIDLFTLVLKGHIALATTKFNKDTPSKELDRIAREPLLEYGYDYNHGTGHGVGSFLDVHEGPQNISKKNNVCSLKPGMIISNEPGVYLKDEFGIRIENLMLVKKSKTSNNTQEKMLEFEILSFVPLDRKLINKEMLTEKEIVWVNEYHQITRKKIANRLDMETKKWFIRITSNI
ncbi:MAG: aminopeptidase P family protein [Alphaproteobacteria bacterium]|jgi:Xaa-Pro aminopeptidase|tara:strand:+ start:20576 stop:22363 length:1788 start_codon:yes stop_codon:yes gene_type:complete